MGGMECSWWERVKEKKFLKGRGRRGFDCGEEGLGLGDGGGSWGGDLKYRRVARRGGG